MLDPTVLWRAPEINPVNRKARSIPGLNPINIYGRVFFFSWFGFMIAFWSWYAFPPLVSSLDANSLQTSHLIHWVVEHYDKEGSKTYSK